jgi:acetyl-CoA acetyltransferase
VATNGGNPERTAVLVDGMRTPIGRFMGAFATVAAPELAATAIRAVVGTRSARKHTVSAPDSITTDM